MTPAIRDSLQFSALTGSGLIEGPVPPIPKLLDMLKRREALTEICVYPKIDDFPRANLSLHRTEGYVVQCFEDATSWGDFLVSDDVTSAPSVEIELGGLALERWPPELFVGESLALEALEYFVDSGKERDTLRWVRIDRFPREILWEGRKQRDAWERSRNTRAESDA